MNIIQTVITVGAITLLSAVTAVAQQPPPPYGAPMGIQIASCTHSGGAKPLCRARIPPTIKCPTITMVK